LGIIETQRLAAGIEAADAAVKSANVELEGYELTKGGGWTVVKVQGDVGAVKAAVNAAAVAAGKVNRVVSTRVIARPNDSLEYLIHSPDTVGDQKPEPPKEPEPPSPDPEPPKEPESPSPSAAEEPVKEEEPVEKAPEEPKEPEQSVEQAPEQPVEPEPEQAPEQAEKPAPIAEEAADGPQQEETRAEEPVKEEPQNDVPAVEPEKAAPAPGKSTPAPKGRKGAKSSQGNKRK
jgi:microcompartment protein CcmL/EutN